MENNNDDDINNINNDFNYDETVEIIDERNGCVSEGKILSIRGDLLIVYNKDKKIEERFNKEDNIVIKLWEPGRPFQVFNRVDIQLIDTNYWVIGMIIDIDKEKEQLCIKYTDKTKRIQEEWINKYSQRIAPIGRHTSGIGTGSLLSAEEINQKLFKNRKFITLNEDQEAKIKKNIEKLNFFIKQMGRDGNCMFRSVSDQIYGNEEYHNVVREKCMDYLLIEREFFSQFVEGGDKEFDNYINMKRKSGVWGDDVELQAISELYNRPIEIYSGSNKPLKTFHENIKDFNLKDNSNKENKNIKVSPIRISYHGNEHYNSVVPTKYDFDIWTNYKDSMIKETPGKYEEEMLKLMKERKLNKLNEKKEIEESRKLFMQTKDKYLDDMLLDLLLNEDGKNDESIIEQSKLEYKKEQDDILQKVIKESINDTKKNDNNNKGLNEMDYFSNPVIQSALECGFSLEDAIMAWTIYGDNQDLVMQYLLSTKSYN
jgi:OTU domain-containing protein 5